MKSEASTDSSPSPREYSPESESDVLDASMSDQDLLKQAFKTSVSRRRMCARSWILEREFDVNPIHPSDPIDPID